MGAVPNPGSQAGLLAELQRRIAALETAPRATRTSVKEGRTTWLDANGNEVVVLGLLDSGGYGVQIQTITGAVLFGVDSVGGQRFPSQPLVRSGGPTFERTFSSFPTYEELHRFDFYCTGTHLYYDFDFDVAGWASGTWEMRFGPTPDSNQGGSIGPLAGLSGVGSGQYSGTIELPPSFFAPGTTDVRGKACTLRLRAYGNPAGTPGTSTVGIRLNGPMLNLTP